MMNSALKMMNSALKMMNCASNMMNSVLNMMNCAAKSLADKQRAEANVAKAVSFRFQK